MKNISVGFSVGKRFIFEHIEAILLLPMMWRIRNFTMLRLEDIYQMKSCVDEMDRKGIEGCIVETGCWRGGNGSYMASLGRKVWLFDSFEGVPELTERDRDFSGKRSLPLHVKTGYLATDESYAREIAQRLGVHPSIIKGWFHDTLSKYKEDIGAIAVLRLDGDNYSSTKEALETLYDSVVNGGIVVIDDYDTWEGCRLAVWEFFAERNIAPRIRQESYGRPFFYKKTSHK